MTMRLGVFVASLLGTSLLGICASAGADDAFFREKIAPILEARCVSCHHGETPKGGLSLTTAGRVKAGGDSGAVFEAGKPDDSYLLDQITPDEKGAAAMPLEKPPLSKGEIALIRQWIEEGDKTASGDFHFQFSLRLAAESCRRELRAEQSDWRRTRIAGVSPQQRRDALERSPTLLRSTIPALAGSNGG